ncbi:MAG: argR [Pseudobdellovibrio sp.]|jgi:transcriptional regulator of arginine metabolism|nr:argR [Pseudobdellovibrio sp.]
MSERSNDTQERLQVLRELIREGEASTQEELCNALKRKKFNVTQSTVSRDLRRIGAVKATNTEGEIIYLLPEQHLAQIPRANTHDISQLIVEIRSNESMIVLHTTPGSASLVAAELDRLRATLGILGTLSGDDTIFVAPVSVKQIAKVEQKIKEEYL